jgi:hypothetical protein
MESARRVCLLVLLWLGAAAQAQAQAPTAVEEEEEEAPAPSAEQRKRFLERLRVMRAWKLTEVLKLEEAAGAKLFAALSRYDDRILEAEVSLREAERALRQGLRRGAGEGELRAMTDEVVKQKRAVDALRLEQFEQAGASLDARRRAELLLFLPRFDKEVRRALRQERERRRRDPAPGEDTLDDPWRSPR